MNTFPVFVISGFSVALPVLAGLLRFRSIGNRYFPLMMLVIIALINESANFYLILYSKSQDISGSNIYVLLELLLIIWLFHRMQINLSNKFLIAIAIFGTMVWLTDNLILHSLRSNNSLFRMVAAFLVIFLSIEKINLKIFSTQRRQTNRTDLLLSTGFFTYFLYKAFIEAFHVFPMHLDKKLYIIMWLILAAINFIVNIVFAIAILCIQQKNPSSTLLSRVLAS